MLELNTSYTFSQVPYITYEALDDYADEIIHDFMPMRLEIPGSFNILDFIRNYLGLSVIYHNLSYDKKVLGVTAFHDDYVQIVDEQSKLTLISINEGTVVIDSSLKTKRNIPRLRFTGIHEGAHWLLHRKAFAKDNPFCDMGVYYSKYLAAKKGKIDYSRSRLEKTDSDRMERQADFLASAILMPRSALRIAYRSFFYYLDEKPRVLVKGKDKSDDNAATQLTDYIADIFNVSKRAALIRLEKLGAIVYDGTRIFVDI